MDQFLFPNHLVKKYKPLPIKQLVQIKILGFRIPKLFNEYECNYLEGYVKFKTTGKYSNIKNNKFIFKLTSRIYEYFPKQMINCTFYCIYPIITILKQSPKTFLNDKFEPKILLIPGYIVKYIGIIHLSDTMTDTLLYKSDEQGIYRSFAEVKGYTGSLTVYDAEAVKSKQSLTNKKQMVLYFYVIYKKNIKLLK